MSHYRLPAEKKMQVFYAYTYGTAAWLGIQAVPLIVLPKMIVTMLARDARQTTGICSLGPFYTLSL